jgi:chaperonin GroEL
LANNQARIITHGDELQDKISEALWKLYLVAKACYGPAAGVALIEPPYGDILASRDGVTNLQKVHLTDPVENMAARIVVQASKKNNQNVGDGTTAVAILAYHLYENAKKLIAMGHNRMEVSRMIENAALNAIRDIDKLTVESNPQVLAQVAAIAAGDEALGDLIADALNQVGPQGGVVIEDFAGTGLFSEIIEGFYFQKGFANVNLTRDPSNLESRYTDNSVLIFITDKVMATSSDIAPILDKVVGSGVRDIIIVGEVLDEAMGALALMRLKGEITATVVSVPPVLGGKSLFLDDLALVTGGKVFAPGASGRDFELEMLGEGKVVVTPTTTTIVGREGDGEAITERIASLNEQLKTATHPTDREALTARRDRLIGKLALIRVGGATDVEQKEVKLRVDDAVRAVQAAARGGIVPGGGVALWNVAPLPAYQQLFRDLMDNAGRNPEAMTALLKPGKPWMGIDLGSDGTKAVDLRKNGIIDPSLVVKETITNATSVVRILITSAVGLTYADRQTRKE